jgi:ferredoxin-NADP reductase
MKGGSHMKFETKVKEIIQRTHNVKSFRFPRPEALNYKAGQFMFVTIKSGDKKLTKHFTISSSPTEKELVEFTKKLTGSPFSNALDAMRPDDWAELNAPYGNFTLEGEFTKVGMLSGGIGITPLMSMCRYCTDLQLNTEITLLYSNRSEQDIAFRTELEKMQKQNKNLKVVFTLTEPNTGWNGVNGRIDVDMIRREMPDFEERTFYTCGSPMMVDAMEKLLKDLAVPKSQIKKENFPGY